MPNDELSGQPYPPGTDPYPDSVPRGARHDAFTHGYETALQDLPGDNPFRGLDTDQDFEEEEIRWDNGYEDGEQERKEFNRRRNRS